MLGYSTTWQGVYREISDHGKSGKENYNYYNDYGYRAKKSVFGTRPAPAGTPAVILITLVGPTVYGPSCS